MTALPPLDRAIRPARRRRDQRISIGAGVSLLLHAAIIGGVVLWTLYKRPVVLVPADTPATVELVMSPPGGVTPPAAAPQPQTTPTPDATQAAKPAPKTPPAEAKADSGTPPPASAPPQPAPAAPPSTNHELTFDFASAESDTNAFVTGNMVVPARPDIKFHNRKPSYPDEAVLRGEQGAVVLLVHVTPEGLVAGIDVLKSSGHTALDRAAQDAVETWHFMPSVKDGRPVGADMPMRFVFALDK